MYMVPNPFCEQNYEDFVDITYVNEYVNEMTLCQRNIAYVNEFTLISVTKWSFR